MNMPISYLQALEVIDTTAQEEFDHVCHDEETVPLLSGIGRTTTTCVKSPCSLPPYDTSAMDGYALKSALTSSSSPENPTIFEIAGITAAGDQALYLCEAQEDSLPLCVEIMTGAQFPCVGKGSQMDACIPIEHTELIRDEATSKQYIKVTRPVRPNQHRRLAGSDIAPGDIVSRAGTALQSQNIMALSALGISEVKVMSKTRVAVCATGSEIVPHDTSYCSADHIRDSNTPYLESCLEDMGLKVNTYQPVTDDPKVLLEVLKKFENSNDDVLVTTGGVSAGKFDFVHNSLVSFGALIRFHKVAIRPGHPVLFATIKTPQYGQPDSDGTPIVTNGVTSNHVQRKRTKAIFGLPGNPIAAAACLQFFVIPFIKRMTGAPLPRPVFAKVVRPAVNSHGCGVARSDNSKQPPDIFRHGLLRLRRFGYEVTINDDQASYKTSPITRSNCWIWIPAFKSDHTQDDRLPCFPFVPTPGFQETTSNYPHLNRTNHLAVTAQHNNRPNHILPSKLKILLLAGGMSTRMKTPKHLLHVNDHRLYEIILHQIHLAFPHASSNDIYISLRSDEQATALKQTHLIDNFRLFPHRILTDLAHTDDDQLLRDIGPAAGLLSAHDAEPQCTWLVVACDYPLINQVALDQLVNEHSSPSAVDTAVPAVTCFVNSAGICEPLLAVWTAEALDQLKTNVQRGFLGPKRTIEHFVSQGRCGLVKPLEEKWMLNTNTPEEWEGFLELCGTMNMLDVEI